MLKPLYRCNPELNETCEKYRCGEWCTMTTRQECSTDGRRLTDDEIYEEEQRIRNRLGDHLFTREEKAQ